MTYGHVGSTITLLISLSLATAHAANDGVEKLLRSHDPEVMIAVGRVYTKQTGLSAIRAVLAEKGRTAGLGTGWNDSAPE
jgi:hypothetical protein